MYDKFVKSISLFSDNSLMKDRKRRRNSFKNAQMLTKQCLKKGLRVQKARFFLLKLYYIINHRLYK